MRAKSILSIIISLLATIGYCNTTSAESELNLGFENILNGKPQGWEINLRENYTVSLDSVTVKSGKYSICIESSGNSADMQTLALPLPNNYAGEKITLSGYIKTENVTDGYAGLGMQIDPPVIQNNMDQNGIITGTIDWKKYEITLDMDPAKTKQIFIGGLFTGKGKMWLDDLQVTIDGIDIKDATIYQKIFFPAQKDNEFYTGSNIIIPISINSDSSSNNFLIDNLELLGKLWGFLKYHHPEIGNGNYNWDYELFRMLPEYLKAAEINQRDQILLSWIEKYGEITECKTCTETPTDAFIKPDLSWIDGSNMNTILKQKIKAIYQNRSQKSHYYIEMIKNTVQPIFVNESPYFNMPYPDAGFRLLSLFKFWNIIHYFSPYKHLTDKNWNNILKEYIPRFISAKTELEYEFAVLHLIGEVNDSHSNLWIGGNKIEEFKGVWKAPFDIRFIENQWVVTDYYKPELKEIIGLNAGDIITHINGKKIESIVDSIKRDYPASNEAARIRNIGEDLLRSPDKTIRINYISANQRKEKELTLCDRGSIYTEPIYDKPSYTLLKDNIGYISLKYIKQEDIANIKKSFINTRGIIIDMQNYPSYYVPFLLGSYFVSDSTSFVKFTKSNLDNPGEFTFTPGYKILKSKEHYQGKLVVIVNEETQSQAEYTAMAFRAGDNTTIIGSTTAGTDGNVSKIFLPGGIMTYISTVGVYYPDGTETQRVGIVPDIEVKPTIKGISEGRDELLEKAIEIINSGN